MKEYLHPGREYAPYTDANFESVVARLLSTGAERRSITEAARDRARWWTFEALLRVALAVGGKGWDEVQERARERTRKPPAAPLAGRVWQRRAALAGPDADSDLVADLTAAGQRHALGALARSPAEAEAHFAAVAPENRVSAVARACGSGGTRPARGREPRGLRHVLAAGRLTRSSPRTRPTRCPTRCASITCGSPGSAPASSARAIRLRSVKRRPGSSAAGHWRCAPSLPARRATFAPQWRAARSGRPSAPGWGPLSSARATPPKRSSTCASHSTATRSTTPAARAARRRAANRGPPRRSRRAPGAPPAPGAVWLPSWSP